MAAAAAPAQTPPSPTAPAAPTAATIRPVPPPGVAIPDVDRAGLTAAVAALGREIESLRAALAARPDLLRRLPDVQVMHKAVDYALRYDEFYDPKDADKARALLALGSERLTALREGKTPWTTQTGPVVLGYVSRIDGSVQPYGLVVPPEWTAADPKPRRLDVVCHGRDEKLTELKFLDQRRRSAGNVVPPGALVLHPYGRYCNANRFAGEIDVLEAMEDVRRRYPVDEDRTVIRGFSMGGASTWMLATHHADRWAAAAPGAGFAETAAYTKTFAEGKTPPPWYEQTLWRLYDSTEYAANLFHCPTVAYHGDKDPQKQAAEVMEAALAKEGLPLARVIAPDTAHKQHPESMKRVDAFLDAAAAKGRNVRPERVRLTTFTLRYNRMHWLTVERLGNHWERARVDARIIEPAAAAPRLDIVTENVTLLALDEKRLGGVPRVTLDGKECGAGTSFVKTSAGWRVAKGADLRPKTRPKRHGLQGPLDDAFLDRFVMVRPTGKPLHPATGAWANAELERARRWWRAQQRGDAPVKDDTAVTDADIRDANLILWGDPSSNAVLARIAPKLPLAWNRDRIKADGQTYPASTTVAVLIYPNPLNPDRYVVLNSGPTWREAHVLTNAQQTPKLPDWAVLDITTPPDAHAPGRVLAADFFNESWRFGKR